jgi:hypothetical protein
VSSLKKSVASLNEMINGQNQQLKLQKEGVASAFQGMKDKTAWLVDELQHRKVAYLNLKAEYDKGQFDIKNLTESQMGNVILEDRLKRMSEVFYNQMTWLLTNYAEVIGN